MSLFSRRGQLAFLFFVVIQIGAAVSQAQPAKNLILFIPDGLRPGSVRADITPALAHVRDQGVKFANSHSVFPTLTMVNAAAMDGSAGMATPTDAAISRFGSLVLSRS